MAKSRLRAFGLIIAAILVVQAFGQARAQEGTMPSGPRLDFPAGLATDGVDVYVANSRNNTIAKIGIGSHSLTVVAGKVFESGSSDGRGASALFTSPGGLAIVGTALYVVDTNNSAVRKINLQTAEVSTIAGEANISGTDDGKGHAAHFNLPTHAASDGKTTIYIADTGNSTIRKITLLDSGVLTIGGKAQTSGNDDGPASKSTFNRPRGLATDGKFLYVADTANQLIRKIDLSNNTTSTIAGKLNEEGKQNGAGAEATFSNPGALATDGTTLYVADADSHAIRKVNLADNTVSSLCEISGHIGSGLTISKDGRSLFISDTTENSIQQVDTTSGTVTPLFPK